MTLAYSYNYSDLFFGLVPWPENGSEFQKSEFDRLLCSAWDKAKECGYFWYSLDDVKTKKLKGSIGLIAQLNTKRFSQRRKPIEITSVQQNFDENRFNFTKVKDHEVLFKINSVATNPRNKTSNLEQNLIIINVSPIDYGHTLLVPDVTAHHPQVVTVNSMKLAIEICLLSKHRGMRIGFNSLCAYASVNHLHFHILYINKQLPLDTASVSFCGSGLFELSEDDYFIRGFALQLENKDTMSLARRVERITSYLYENEIPYNMFLCRSDMFQSDNLQPSNESVVKVFIFPKYSAPVNAEFAFNSAALESCGFLPMRDKEEYENLTEMEAVRILNNYAYKEDEFLDLKNKLTFHLETSCCN